MRASGILMPISSLPSKYGIGAFSESAYKFVDQLEKAGQSYWQILPLGPTGYGDSPYQSFSTFAGNPYFIDLDALAEEGLLTNEECASYDFGCDERYIDYEKIYFSRFKILKKAFERVDLDTDAEFIQFYNNNEYWLIDYCLYMSIKDTYHGKSILEWDNDIRLRKPEAIEKAKAELEAEQKFYTFLQYLFWKQWSRLKDYANKKGVKIIGDIPIYVAFDSADSWAHPELFQFDSDRRPSAVAGCPPDGFSATGQLWGNPLYNWEYHKQTSYDWWLKRISYCFKLYDVVRVDHFRGFDEYYSVPFGESTAVNGHWEKGPGIELFRTFQEKLGDLNIIAEDLGYMTDGVRQLVEDTGYPGMKVLQFAFDAREESDYLPHNYSPNCVVYTGTHDNDTIKGWFETVSEDDKQVAIDYVNLSNQPENEIPWSFIRLALSSVAKLAVIPLQDYLCLGSEARINFPSTLGDNWKWRLKDGELTDEILAKISHLTKLYGR